jgi:hypothetical protein
MRAQVRSWRRPLQCGAAAPRSTTATSTPPTCQPVPSCTRRRIRMPKRNETKRQKHLFGCDRLLQEHIQRSDRIHWSGERRRRRCCATSSGRCRAWCRRRWLFVIAVARFVRLHHRSRQHAGQRRDNVAATASTAATARTARARAAEQRRRWRLIGVRQQNRLIGRQRYGERSLQFRCNSITNLRKEKPDERHIIRQSRVCNGRLQRCCLRRVLPTLRLPSP